METPWVADVRTWGLEIPELSRIVTGAREDELLEILSQTKDSVTRPKIPINIYQLWTTNKN